jgi:membrane protein DedA with SNARE-associated domain
VERGRALVWAPTVVTQGYVAGNSWEQVDRALGWGSLVIAVMLVGGWFGLRQVRRERHRRPAGPARPHRRQVAGRDTPA